MIRAERFASVSAMLSAIGALACCLPLGIPAALGLIGLNTVMPTLQPWLLGISVVLLGVGFLTLFKRGRACQRRSRFSLVLLITATAIVFAVVVFPQVLADLLARLA